MKKPNPATYNPDPEYLRRLLDKAGLTQAAAARALRVTTRTMRAWLAPVEAASMREIPYTAQFTLEVLAEANARRRELLRS
jgi:uncharacterized protein (DUF2267 family)